MFGFRFSFSYGFGFGQSRPVIRPLRSERAEACARLHATGFAHPWSAEELARLIADPSTVSAAAVDPAKGKLRGFAIARIAADEGEILTIVVAARYRHWGVGRALMIETLRKAVNSGARTMFLEVDEDNISAVRLYLRLGFEKVGERPGYYRRKDGSRALAVVMRKAVS